MALPKSGIRSKGTPSSGIRSKGTPSSQPVCELPSLYSVFRIRRYTNNLILSNGFRDFCAFRSQSHSKSPPVLCFCCENRPLPPKVTAKVHSYCDFSVIFTSCLSPPKMPVRTAGFLTQKSINLAFTFTVRLIIILVYFILKE